MSGLQQSGNRRGSTFSPTSATQDVKKDLSAQHGDRQTPQKRSHKISPMDSQRHAQAFHHQQGQQYGTPVPQQPLHPRVQQLRGRAARAASPQRQRAGPPSPKLEAPPPMGNDPPAIDFDEQAFGQRLLAELGRAPLTPQEGQVVPGNSAAAAEDQLESTRESGFTPNFTPSSPVQEYTAVSGQNNAGAFTPPRDTIVNIDAASFFSDEANALLQDPFLPMPSPWLPNQDVYGMAFSNRHAEFPGSMAYPNANDMQYLPFVPTQPSYPPIQPYQPIEQAPAFEDDVWYDDFSQGFPAAPVYQHPSFPVPTSMAPIQSHETIDLTQEPDDVVPKSPIQKRKRSNDDIGKESSSFKKQALAFQPPSHPPGPPPPPPSNPNRRRQLKGHRHIQGFPPAGSPLPPNIEFCDILYEYPNHVHGELILRMNREGGYTVRMMRETSKCLVPPNPKDKGNPKGVYVLEEKELKNRLASARPRLDPEGKGSKRKRKSSDEDDKSHDDAKVDGALVESAAKRAKVDDEGTADATSRISSAGNAQYPTPPKTVPSSPIVATFPQSPSKLSAPAPAPVPTLAAPAATKMTSNSCLALQNRMHDFLHDHFHDHMLEINLNKSYKKKTNTYTNDIHKYAEEMIERREKIAKGEVVEGDEPVKPKVTGIIKGVKASVGEEKVANHRQGDAAKACSSNSGTGVYPVVVKVDRKKPPRSAGVGYSGVKKAWRDKKALVKKNKKIAEGKGKGVAWGVGVRQVEQQQQQQQLARYGSPSVAESEQDEEEDGEFDIDEEYHQDHSAEKEAHDYQDDVVPPINHTSHNDPANAAKGQDTDNESDEASDEDEDDDLKAELIRLMGRAEDDTTAEETEEKTIVEETGAPADEEEEEGEDDGLEAEVARFRGSDSDDEEEAEEEVEQEPEEEDGATGNAMPYHAVDEESEESEEE